MSFSRGSPQPRDSTRIPSKGTSNFSFVHPNINSTSKKRVVGMTFSSVQLVQSLSHVRLFATLWTATLQASLSIANSQNLLKFMSIKSVMSSNHFILYRPLLHPPSIFPSIRVFSNEAVLHIRWPTIGASASASGVRLNIQD